jgi:hypothetical protein
MFLQVDTRGEAGRMVGSGNRPGRRTEAAMRRLIFGAVALVTGLLAAVGVALTRRHRNRDEVLELDPAPPFGSGESGATTDASVEADFGPVGEPAEPEAPARPKRRARPRRKPAKAVSTESADGTESGEQANDSETAATTGSAKSAESVEPAEAAEAPAES